MPMVNHGPQLGSQPCQDNGGDGLQEQDDFGAKALGAINASQHIAVGDKTWHWLPRTRKDSSAGGGRKTAASLLGPLSSREKERLGYELVGLSRTQSK